jgi:hypothetical protein
MLSSALLEMDEEDVDDKDEDIADDDPVLNQIRFLCLLYPRSPKGEGWYTVLPLSVRPSKIFFVAFF